MEADLKADLNYIKERDSLIPAAQKFADSECGERPHGKLSQEARELWNAKWTKTFLGKMDALYKELKRRK